MEKMRSVNAAMIQKFSMPKVFLGLRIRGNAEVQRQQVVDHDSPLKRRLSGLPLWLDLILEGHAVDPIR